MDFIWIGGLSCWIWILSLEVWLGWRVVRGEFYYVLFFFDSDWAELIWIVFVDNASAKFSTIMFAMFFPSGFCISLREVISWVVDVFICYFLYKVPNYFWIGIGVHFWGEDSPRWSLIVFQALALCICLDFLMRDLFWISWGLFDVLLSNFSIPLWTMVYCDFGDSFIGYGNEGIGKMYYGFFLICICFWD